MSYPWKGFFLTLFIQFYVTQVQAGIPDKRQPPKCRDYYPEKQLLWGDLHVHTALSMDAYMMGSRTGPEDAYRFARGEKISLYDGLDVQIDRPLDFAAITDHATEWGTNSLCSDPDSSQYSSKVCQQFRIPYFSTVQGKTYKEMVKGMLNITSGKYFGGKVCGKDGRLCDQASKDVWKRTVKAAEDFNDKTDACQFTTFSAYEYTATPQYSKVHRNVIFKNDQVIEKPVSYSEEPEVEALWQRLKEGVC